MRNIILSFPKKLNLKKINFSEGEYIDKRVAEIQLNENSLFAIHLRSKDLKYRIIDVNTEEKCQKIRSLMTKERPIFDDIESVVNFIQLDFDLLWKLFTDFEICRFY